MDTEKVKNSSSASSRDGIEYQRGSFAERLVAYIIDAVILFVIDFILFSLVGKNSLVTLIGAVISLLYGIIFLAVRGATPGKMLLKLQVLSSQYEKIGLGTAILREFPGKLISRIPFDLGFLWVLKDQNREAWHDKIAHTVVVKVDSSGKPIPQAVEEVVTTKQKIYFWILAVLSALQLVILPLILICYFFFLRPFQVTGDSMNPSFHTGEYVLMNVMAVKSGEVKRGDVVIFKAPIDVNKDFIKRIIAMPGDKVVLREGDVYVNGVIMDESSYLSSGVRTYAGSFMRENEEITVPSDSYLVLGDNRPFSSDSREWGFIKKSDIIGKYLLCYANCSK